jgi:hypothetical protein
MTTVKWVFDRAVELMNEMDDRTGETMTVDTKEYEVRTLGLINTLRNELYPYSDTYELRTDGKRTVCPVLERFDQILDLDDVVAQTILPYGLAAHLLLDDNPTMAAFFNDRYQELIYTVGSKRPSVWEDIPTMY